jgi:hypothetical protein
MCRGDDAKPWVGQYDRCLATLKMETLTANANNINVGVGTDVNKRDLVAALSPVHDDVCFGCSIESGGGG